MLGFAIGGYNDFIRFAKNEEIRLAEELYTNTFAHNIYSGLYSIALEYGAISNEIFLNTVFIAMGLCIATGITIGIYNNIRANKEKEEKIYELNEKIYNLKKEKSALELDIERLENNKTL